MAFIYLWGFLACLALNIAFPALKGLLDVIETVCLGGIIVFALFEIHTSGRKNTDNKKDTGLRS